MEINNMKEKIQKIIEEFEVGLCSAGVDANDVDYDILSEVRMKCWKELEDLIK